MCQELQAKLPQVTIQQWPDISDPTTVVMAVLWNHPPGITDAMPNLKMVVSMGAGMDHIEQDVHIADHISRQRIVTLALRQNMAQYVIQHMLSDYRHQKAYQQQQLKHQWQVLETDEQAPTVGFLGLGQLGCYVADRCAELGFQTMAWTAQQNHPRHPCFQGQAGLKKVCENSRYLVVLLPLNEQTQGIINQQTLSWCHTKTTLINVGRGGHVNDTDLLQALNLGLIKQAVLDVFNKEPLPINHPFWKHPKITLTPHSSSRSDVKQTAKEINRIYQQL